MKLVLLILLILPIISFGQVIIYDTSAYTEVVRVDSVSKDELYTRARSWYATTFKSANHVIQMDDRGAGKIIGKGNITYKSKWNPGHNGWIFFTYIVETRMVDFE